MYSPIHDQCPRTLLMSHLFDNSFFGNVILIQHDDLIKIFMFLGQKLRFHIHIVTIQDYWSECRGVRVKGHSTWNIAKHINDLLTHQ